MRPLNDKKLLSYIKEDNDEKFKEILNKNPDIVIWVENLDFNISNEAAVYGASKISRFLHESDFRLIEKSENRQKKNSMSESHRQLISYSSSGDLKAIIELEQAGVDLHFYNCRFFYDAILDHHRETALYLFKKNKSMIQRTPYIIAKLAFFSLEHDSEWQFDNDIQEEIHKLKEDILFLLELGFDINTLYQRTQPQTALDAALDWLRWANPYAGEIVLFLAAHGGMTHAEIQQPELLSRDNLRQRRQACLHQASLACVAFYQGCQASLDRSWAQHLPSQAASIENLLLAQNALSYEAKMLNQRLQNMSQPGSVLSSEAEELYLQLEQLQQQRLGPLKQLLEKTDQDAELPHFWRFLIQACPPKAQAPGRLMRYKEILSAGLHIEAEVQQVLQRFSQC